MVVSKKLEKHIENAVILQQRANKHIDAVFKILEDAGLETEGSTLEEMFTDVLHTGCEDEILWFINFLKEEV